MSDKDFTVNAVGQISSGAVFAGGLGASQISKKPSYLVTLLPIHSAGKKTEYFLTVDKPDFVGMFLQVKGVFLEEKEEEILNNIATTLTSIKKELTLEMYFPVHRICSIRSLVFNANKSNNLGK